MVFPPDSAPHTSIQTPLRQLLVVAAVVLYEDGKILLAQRPAHKPYAGEWEFPGGKLEKGENPEQALVRELHEELDIEVAIDDLIPLTFASYTYPEFHLLMPVYACTIWHGMVHAKEKQTLEWIALSDIIRYPLLAADKPLIPFIQNFLHTTFSR